MHRFALVALSALCAFAAAPQAKADSLRISIGDDHRDWHRGRDWHRHHGWKHDRHPHWKHHHRHGWGYGPRQVIYVPQPPVVVQRTYIQSYGGVPVQQAPNVYSDMPRPPQHCREYYGPANVGGRVVQTYGTACLQPDGSWRIMD